MTLSDFLHNYGVNSRASGQHEHVRPGWVGVDCPQCSPGWMHFRLGINERSLACHCWVCGTLDSASTLAILTGLTKNRVWGQLERKSITERNVAQGNGCLLRLPYGVTALLPAHEHYLNERGFNSKQIVRTWGVQGLGAVSERGLSWRLFIPITLGGEVVSWTTRALTDEGTRYVGAPSGWEKVPKGELLYGEDLAGYGVVVCEGPTDVWRVGPGAVATLGVAVTRAQRQRLSRFPRRVVCFDREDAAQDRARRLCRELAAFPGETHNVVLWAEDPGAAGDEEINELRRRFLT